MFNAKRARCLLPMRTISGVAMLLVRPETNEAAPPFSRKAKQMGAQRSESSLSLAGVQSQATGYQPTPPPGIRYLGGFSPPNLAARTNQNQLS